MSSFFLFFSFTFPPNRNRTGNTMIQFDLGSAGFYSESALYRVLDTAVRSSQVGRYSVDPNELDFAPLPGTYQHH